MHVKTERKSYPKIILIYIYSYRDVADFPFLLQVQYEARFQVNVQNRSIVHKHDQTQLHLLQNLGVTNVVIYDE